MKLHRISITNFRSYKGEQTFHFPDEPGLYFMQGINKAEPRLEGNASGKTTIWEALTWCLFGKTSTGLKAGDVCNWDAGKGAKVEFAFETEDKLSLQVMTRTWSPNSWTLQDLFGKITDLTKDQSNPVLDRIRLDFSPFLNSILTAQKQPMFLDQPADVKATLFSDVMGLDRWLDYSGRASKKASDQDSISRGHERDLAKLKGQLEALQGQDFTRSMEEWEAERDRKADDIADAYGVLLAKTKKIEANGHLPGLKAKAEEARLKAKDAKEILDDLIAERKKLSREVGDHRQQLGKAEAEYKHALEASEEIAAGKCPTCGQKVSRDHKHAPKESLGSILRKVDEARKDLDRADKRLAKLEGDEDRAGDRFDALQARYDQAQREYQEQNRAVAMLERELDDLEDAQEKLEKEVNPYAALQEESRLESRRIRSAIGDLQRALDASNHRYSILSFWVKGFKELRLQQIGEALAELEVEVNSCVASLGLVDWELKFQIDRENKGGGFQKGFNVFVLSPHNRVQVPWSAWSGGEGQRLRIAGNMGLANLIRSRTGSDFPLEVWDEPSNGLSPQGVTDLLESLAARARHENRQIWIVDHTSHSFGGFAGGATITKTLKGSTLAQY